MDDDPRPITVPSHCDRCQRSAVECGMDTLGWVTILPPREPAGLYCMECGRALLDRLGQDRAAK
jgi:hypothetical protein